MLSPAELERLRTDLPADPDKSGLLDTLRARAGPVLAALPPIPRVKALLSRDGGVCPNDGAPLEFDPWSPDRHRCPRCGTLVSGERHHRHWARAQHLWLAERAAELALLAALTDDERAAARAGELLGAYESLYFELPNRDNVLGPSHLFFSTYLESLWLSSYLAAGYLLREAGLLESLDCEGIDAIAEEAASLIGDFNEGLSNRQTWHAAALTAIAAWFADEELATTAIDSRVGLLGHLADGFGADGLWWEGENYHLFALRGLMQGIQWARLLGWDLLEQADARQHFREALLGPTRSALPDFTYPARRDSRFGVSLAQPASLELWEIGRAWLAGDSELDAWLGALYASPPPAHPPEPYDAWLHDAGRPVRAGYSRRQLSWWALAALQPAPATAPDWQPASVLLSGQGLAVLRHGDAYASLECGAEIGGHGHPDRLHLTLHQGGVHWLPDQGSGSYVQPSLAWYRSALAHNAPLLDGVNAGGADAWCEAFEAGEEWAWCRAKAGELRRTLILAPTHLLDVVELDAGDSRQLELPWHFQGDFSSGAERQATGTDSSEPRRLTVDRLRVWLLAPEAELLRPVAPGLPVDPTPRPYLLLRATGSVLRWVSVVDFAAADSPRAITSLRAEAGLVELGTAAHPIRYHFSSTGLLIKAGDGGSVTLSGLRPPPPRYESIFGEQRPAAILATAPRLAEAPALDGTLEGFVLATPLELNSEEQYRRSESLYDAEAFSATAWANWDGKALYLAVEVTKPELLFRAPDAQSLLLDNEPDDIHSDGLQVYWETDATERGFLIVPEQNGSIRARPITPSDAAVSGRWRKTGEGYRVTLKLEDPNIAFLGPGAPLRFDLLINEMQSGRVRRAGQLVWSGGHGWVYLRGDRHDLTHAGILQLG